MKTFIVDGYNVIRTTNAYGAVSHNDFEASATNPARDRLIADVAAWAQSSRAKAIVVFAGMDNPLSTGEEHQQAGVTVCFSKYGQTADSLIESLARKAVERNEQVTVVSSDSTIKWTVGVTDVFTMSSRNFMSLMGALHEDQTQALEERRTHMTLGSRIDPEVAKRLSEFLRK